MRASAWRDAAHRDRRVRRRRAPRHARHVRVPTTQVLGNGVREHGVLSWEEAVHQLTDVPARLYGMRERGRLRAGLARRRGRVRSRRAVATGPTYMRFDLPGGAGRLYADAVGIDARVRERRRDRAGHRAHRRDAGHGAALGPRYRDGRSSGRRSLGRSRSRGPADGARSERARAVPGLHPLRARRVRDRELVQLPRPADPLDPDRPDQGGPRHLGHGRWAS